MYRKDFVVLGFWVLRGGPLSLGPVAYADTIDDARSVMPDGYECKPRDLGDPERVVESWI